MTISGWSIGGTVSGPSYGERMTGVRVATDEQAKTYAALLRGINVGGNKKVPMAELRTLLEGLGYGGVRTYLQSGNAVFAAGHGDEESLAGEITKAIAQHFGFTVDVIVRDHAHLRAIRDDCPFPAAELEARQLHVTYFSTPVDEARFADID